MYWLVLFNRCASVCFLVKTGVFSYGETTGWGRDVEFASQRVKNRNRCTRRKCKTRMNSIEYFIFLHFSSCKVPGIWAIALIIR
jgi:hypothetical protein